MVFLVQYFLYQFFKFSRGFEEVIVVSGCLEVQVVYLVVVVFQFNYDIVKVLYEVFIFFLIVVDVQFWFQVVLFDGFYLVGLLIVVVVGNLCVVFQCQYLFFEVIKKVLYILLIVVCLIKMDYKIFGGRCIEEIQCFVDIIGLDVVDGILFVKLVEQVVQYQCFFLELVIFLFFCIVFNYFMDKWLGR